MADGDLAVTSLAMVAKMVEFEEKMQAEESIAYFSSWPIYLLTALFLGGFGNYLIPLMCGARDMVFPFMNMLSYWVYLVAVLILLASFFVPGGPTGAGCGQRRPSPSRHSPP